jgi:hypothetical protein
MLNGRVSKINARLDVGKMIIKKINVKLSINKAVSLLGGIKDR